MEAFSSFENRRDDFRRSASNYRLRVRRRGIRGTSGFHDCGLVDLSQGGMSFASSTHQFRLLDAVEFELVSEVISSRGRGVICYVQRNQSEQRCGVAFTQGNPELDALCSGQQLSSTELQRLGRDVAEDFVARSDMFHSRSRSVRQRAVDVLIAFATRLDELGVRLSVENGQSLRPSAAIGVDELGQISLPVRCQGGVKRVRIGVEADADEVWYYTVDQVRCASVVDLLREVCQRFEELKPG